MKKLGGVTPLPTPLATDILNQDRYFAVAVQAAIHHLTKQVPTLYSYCPLGTKASERQRIKNGGGGGGGGGEL